MSDEMPMWKGLFEWSMSYQDGTNNAGPSNARPLSETDRQWLEEALKGAMLDLSNRMQDISIALNEPETGGGETTAPSTTATPETPSTTPLKDKERMLDELMDIVESIDQAKDLSTVGGLPTLLHLLSSPHPSLRWRAAEVIATCVQNNPEVQEAFLQGGVLPALWPLLTLDGDAPTIENSSSSSVCLVKGMLAVSCQIRGHAASLQWFRDHDGLKKLIEILQKGEPRVQRKSLQMLEYVLQTVPNDRQTAIKLTLDGDSTNNSTTTTSSFLLSLVVRLVADSEDGDIRSAALGVLHQLAGDDVCLVEMQKESSGVVAAVQAVQCKLDSLPKDEWGPAEEEAKLAVQVMEELVKKKVTVVGTTTNSSVEAERSGSMQLMALPDQQ